MTRVSPDPNVSDEAWEDFKDENRLDLDRDDEEPDDEEEE